MKNSDFFFRSDVVCIFLVSPIYTPPTKFPALYAYESAAAAAVPIQSNWNGGRGGGGKKGIGGSPILLLLSSSFPPFLPFPLSYE